jgi:hypothetical protein
MFKNDNEKYPIKEEWEHYYQMLEAIRKSGVVNMWGSSQLLKECCPELTTEESKNILCNWISNYDKLNKKYHWQ